MTELTRRKTIIGMGLLAGGSGAAFSSAAFANSTTPDADLRVVVEESLNFRANPDAADADNILDTDEFEEFFDGDDIDDSADGAFEDLDTPLAATNGEANNSLEIFAVAGIGESATFSELFELENNSTEAVAVGIAYDRGNEEFESEAQGEGGQYGGDVVITGTGGEDELLPTIPRSAYQFRVNGFSSDGSLQDDNFTDENNDNGLISPAENAEGGVLDGEAAAEDEATFVGGNSGISDFNDRPADAIVLQPGQEVTIDLEVDIDFSSDVEDVIRSAAGISLDGFGTERATVDLLDGITVGTLTGEPSGE